MKRLACIALVIAACHSPGGPEAPGSGGGTPSPGVSAAAPGVSVAPGGTAATASLQVAADDPRQLEAAMPAHIPLASVNTLLFRFLVPEMPDAVGWVTVSLYTPSGAVRQQLHLPFSPDPNVTEVAAPGGGVPHPIQVLRALPAPGGFSVTMSIPVGGTYLQKRPQPGSWKAVATLDRHPEIQATATFDFTM
jgi:hypothetical protein